MSHSRARSGLTRILAMAAVALITLLGASAPALAAKGGGGKPSKTPTVSVTATVSGDDVTFIVEVDRPASKILFLTCYVGEQRVACPFTSGDKRHSTFTGSASDLIGGQWRASAQGILSDGRTAFGGETFFTIGAPPPPPAPLQGKEECAGLGGSYSSTLVSWYCNTSDLSLSLDALSGACSTIHDILTSEASPSFRAFVCATAEATAARTACVGAAGGTWRWALQRHWVCEWSPTANGPLATQLQDLCPTEFGAEYSILTTLARASCYAPATFDVY